MEKSVSFVSVLTVAFCVTAFAKDKEHQEVKQQPAAGFATAYTKVVKGAERFENANYFTLMAADGIHKVDPKTVYERLQAAVAANERYKALYLARIFTDLKPDAPAAWSNRARLASALGLSEEASACEQNARNPSQRVNVPLADILPGTGLGTRPTTLSDWAAATALLSDGIAEKEGKRDLVSFKDLVSGIHQATEEEIAERDQNNRDAGLNPSGPWADPEPVQLCHVLANAFDLRSADPMHDKSVSKGGMFAAMMMAGLSGMQQNMNPAMAQQTMGVAQQMAGRASQVPSHYQGGSYTRVVFDNGKEVATPDHPQTSGEDETVGKPLPFLWASGGSTEPYFTGYWKSNDGMKVKKITASNLDDEHNSHAKRYRPPTELRFPKLMSLCTSSGAENTFCSNPLSLMELLLTKDDVATLAPQLSSNLVDLDRFRQQYDSGALNLEPGNGGHNRVWGGDDEGAMYELNLSSTSWLISAR
jgi:hypothetical protein